MTADWCSAPEELDDADLRLLLQAATSVLAESAHDESEAADLVERPPSVAAADVGVAVGGSERLAVDRLVDDPATDRALALVLVREVCAIPALRDEVDEAYAARKRMMVVDPGTVLAVSLLLLVLKLRRVKVGREGVDVELDPVRDGGLRLVAKLLGGAG
jgi:hypothetical protein